VILGNHESMKSDLQDKKRWRESTIEHGFCL